MQSVDYTTLMAICAELQPHWLPARIEQVYQHDRHGLSLALRTLENRGWLTLAWHPQGARICLDTPPPQEPDTFTFSDQLRHQLKGLALISLEPLQPWERVIDLAIAKRPGDEPLYHLFLEVMGKYSNLILTDAQEQIITVAHQVNAQQSRVRTVQTGQPYQPPPALLATPPSLTESFSNWQERVQLIPGLLSKQLLKSYRGVSPMVVRSLLNQAGLDSQINNQNLTGEQWQSLFTAWQNWLQRLEKSDFQGKKISSGYTVLGKNSVVNEVKKIDAVPPQQTADTLPINQLISEYYRTELGREDFQQLRHQIQQKLANLIAKLQQKADTFKQRLAAAANAQQYQQQADLLMAYLHQGQPGLNSITLPDFTDQSPVTIPLQPDKTLIQNAQRLYKQQQKLNRAEAAILPLLAAVKQELAYLTQVETSVQALTKFDNLTDWQTLTEIRDELAEQNYLTLGHSRPRRKETETFQPQQVLTPSGFPVWIGRNNRQNDYLTFRVATEYDLWFHAQEIAGSHVLLRLPPGAIAEDRDLQSAADWAAYYSRGRGEEQVPVVYTEPKYVFKPKGSKPGMVIYQQETVIWGKPGAINLELAKS
ncbi:MULTISPECIES: NFACT family protein [unclassified Synechocystis]|uniref:Rqc2 family fibronectin-binding protein n=1 Tax=unclassified Synechocystis TaxID=2640012 RepID=UPI0004227E43|nr:MULTISPECIES: NFACT family protein [unclassified Synechocystis]AIE74731.1 Fibronectin/fibrinogen-binding protein [Synechocystis sp. PCC 6714]MCT0253919.1 NFACT family protein [Synechocystis sp. CS-94]